MSQSNLSIYIPRMSALTTVEEVERQLKHNIGLVLVRVDFIPVNKKAGFVEVHDKMVKSAFAHGHWTSANGDVAQKKILKELSEGGSHRISPSLDEDWFLTKCTNPIQDTMMNTAQIVENCRLLENKVAEHTETIAKLEKGLEAVQLVVYQLVVGQFLMMMMIMLMMLV